MAKSIKARWHVVVPLIVFAVAGGGAFTLPRWVTRDDMGLSAGFTAGITLLACLLVALLASIYAFVAAWRFRKVLGASTRGIALAVFPLLVLWIVIQWSRHAAEAKEVPEELRHKRPVTAAVTHEWDA